ncbi:MAG: arginine--tRNA ligase [Longimicrobiales bacterium]
MPSVRRAPAETLVQQLERIVDRLEPGERPHIRLDRPRTRQHGDFTTNLALVLAGPLSRQPRELASWIIDQLDLEVAGFAAADVAGPGFINFRLATESLHDRLEAILRAGDAWGRAARPSGRRVQVEFVSANPTGPLHVAHGRGAALGDAIASLLEWTGDDVTREFYINDAGAQIDKLAESLEARWLDLGGQMAAVPEGGYHGEYMRDLARRVEAEMGVALRATDRDQRLRMLRERAVQLLREEQERDLREFRVHFDVFFEESRLYREGQADQTLRELSERHLTYEADGAVWLRSSDFGDDKDHVLVKRDGSYTYLVPDVAYHRNKNERGFDHVIDVWGADHHGYVPRMQAALSALGLDGFLDVEIVQMVRIVRGGKDVRLSKRAGEFVTLRELFEEFGVDVARYFFLMRRSDAQMLFDLDLALDHTEKNPVFKVQYAHARMMSIFRKAGIRPDEIQPGPELSLLEHESERELANQLAHFPDVVTKAASARAPHMVCEYLETTAGLINSWYHAGNPSRNPELAVLVPDQALRAARLMLARAIQITLRNGLNLLSLNAPDRMERE